MLKAEAFNHIIVPRLAVVRVVKYVVLRRVHQLTLEMKQEQRRAYEHAGRHALDPGPKFDDVDIGTFSLRGREWGASKTARQAITHRAIKDFDVGLVIGTAPASLKIGERTELVKVLLGG